jgi:DNA (cytosine-5)-methyltransferase 1
LTERKPRLLDLFCGAGGAAMGYSRAGFDVVGVDIRPQPNYPFEFVQADAMDCPCAWMISYFDAIHASPPCQHYAGVTAWRGDRDMHPDLVARTRDLLERTGLPWVIENVREAPITGHVLLCGTRFGLPFRRHRHFETSWNGWTLTQPCRHSPADRSFDHGGKQPESVYRDTIGCEWMTVAESREAVPPVYTELVGHQLMQHLLASPDKEKIGSSGHTHS